VENQHKLIDGYRELDEGEIAGMNAVKRAEQAFLAVVRENQEIGADPRWTAIAITAIEKASMFAGRAIARPDGTVKSFQP
jgi:hypothetical protein